MGRFLIILGLLVLLAGGALGISLYNSAFPPDEGTFSLSSFGFDSNSVVSAEEWQDKEAEANSLRQTALAGGLEDKRTKQSLLFSVIIFGGLISLVAGLREVFSERKTLATMLAVVLALLGTSSAVASMAAQHYDQRADTRFQCRASISEQVSKTFQNVNQETKRPLALGYMTEMIEKAKECALAG